MIKIKCIDNAPHNREVGRPCLILGKVYVVGPLNDDDLYTIDGLTWGKSRFKVVDNDDYEPAPVTMKSPNRGNNNEVDTQEMIDFFSRPQAGNCKCGGPKALCPYHKD